MKKALSRIVSLLLVLCLVTALVPAVFAADENEVQILFLDTSDVHGQQFATDYTQDASLSGTHYQGMTRVATYVKEQRAEYKNVFLSDSGDTIQGTPLTYYYAFMKKDVDDPAMKVMRMMDYDMWVVDRVQGRCFHGELPRRQHEQRQDPRLEDLEQLRSLCHQGI